VILKVQETVDNTLKVKRSTDKICVDDYFTDTSSRNCLKTIDRVHNDVSQIISDH
jgi:hypothetical protein